MFRLFAIICGSIALFGFIGAEWGKEAQSSFVWGVVWGYATILALLTIPTICVFFKLGSKNTNFSYNQLQDIYMLSQISLTKKAAETLWATSGVVWLGLQYGQGLQEVTIVYSLTIIYLCAASLVVYGAKDFVQPYLAEAEALSEEISLRVAEKATDVVEDVARKYERNDRS